MGLPESSRDSMTDNHSSKLPERWRPSKACSHRSTIWREDSVSCNLLSQSSRTPSRPSKRSLMSEEWERNEHISFYHEPNDNNYCYLRTKYPYFTLTKKKKKKKKKKKNSLCFDPTA